MTDNKNQITVWITTGIACSGKLEWAARMAQITGGFVSCRDKMREALTGAPLKLYRHTPKIEELISEMRDYQMEFCRDEGIDMIIADTNLNPVTLQKILDECKQYEAKTRIVEFIPSLSKSINVNKHRGCNGGILIPKGVLAKQHEVYKTQYTAFINSIGLTAPALAYSTKPNEEISRAEMLSIAKALKSLPRNQSLASELDIPFKNVLI